MQKKHPLLDGIEDVQPYPMLVTNDLHGLTPPPMVIESFLPAGGVMGMTSYPGMGKTWLAMEVARTVVGGVPFLNRYPTERGGVLFVGSDSSLYDYARQWVRLTTGDNALYREGAKFLIQSSFMFENTDEVRKLISTCLTHTYDWDNPEFDEDGNVVNDPIRDPETGEYSHRKGFDVIIFDTLSRLTRANQNDNTEMEEVFRNIRLIAELTGAAIVLLHHNSKPSEHNDGSDWRGAMSQIGALDSWVQLVKPKKQTSTDGSLLVGIQFKKFRGITPDDFAFRMSVNDEGVARLYMVDEPVTMLQRLQADPVADALRDQVTQCPGLRAAAYRDVLWAKFQDEFKSKDKFASAVNNRLKALCSKGLLLRRTEDGITVYEAPEPDKTDSES